MNVRQEQWFYKRTEKEPLPLPFSESDSGPFYVRSSFLILNSIRKIPRSIFGLFTTTIFKQIASNQNQGHFLYANPNSSKTILNSSIIILYGKKVAIIIPKQNAKIQLDFRLCLFGGLQRILYHRPVASGNCPVLLLVYAVKINVLHCFALPFLTILIASICYSSSNAPVYNW